MLTPPQNTFPPEQYRAFQWTIDTIREHDRLLGLNESSAENAGMQVNSSMDQLNRSVSALNEMVDRLSAQQQALELQQQTLGAQQSTLESQQTSLNNMVNRLTDAGQVYSNSVGTVWAAGPGGWVSGPPSVTASSMSRRFRVTVTAGSAGGTTFVTFSASGYDRDRALGGDANAIRSRGSALGGAADPGTASRSFIVTMPGTGEYTFTAQAYRTDSYVSVIGLEIMVEPIL